MTDLPAFEFACPTQILCGRLALEHLPSELAERGCGKPLFLFSRQTSIRSFPKIIHRAFADSGISIGVVRNISSRPEREDLSALKNILSQSSHDAVIAVGNRGVADLAKLLCLSSPEENLEAHPEIQIKSSIYRAITCGVIPQADATGLETSGHATTPWLRMQSINLMPDFVVLDHRTAAPQNIQSALRAAVCPLARAVEQAARPEGSPFAETYATAAIELMFSGLEPLLNGRESDKAFLSLASGIADSGLSVGDAPAGQAFRLCKTVSEAIGADPVDVVIRMFPIALEEIPSYRRTVLGGLLYPMTGIDRYAATPESKRHLAAIGCLRDILSRLHRAAGGIPVPKFGDAGIKKTTLLNRVAAVGVEGVDDVVVGKILDRTWSDESAGESGQGEDR